VRVVQTAAAKGQVGEAGFAGFEVWFTFAAKGDLPALANLRTDPSFVDQRKVVAREFGWGAAWVAGVLGGLLGIRYGVKRFRGRHY